MRAITISRFGPPDVLTEVELPDPRPAAGQVAIDVTHAAVGMIDVFFRRGDFSGDPQFPTPSFVPGIKVAGTIRELGEGITDFRVGETVVTLSLMTLGGYATVALADARLTVSLTSSTIDPAQVVAMVPNATTAYLALTTVAHLRAGETVLVHGATGGLASVFPAVARALGAARILGTVGASSKADVARSIGYDEVLTHDRFPDALSGQKFDLIVDPVGGPAHGASLDTPAPLGRMLLVGHASTTPEEPMRGNDLWRRSIGVLGFSVGPLLQAHPMLARPAASAVIDLIEQGTLHVPIETLPLTEASEAHRRLEARDVTGRVILTT
jgi:NADPH2:quinone reductase